MANCGGWSSSGGPWNTPEHAMQFVTTSEMHVTGPTKFDEVLPQPPTKLNYYQDIEVLAFPTPPAELQTLAQRHPKITASSGAIEAANLLDGDPNTQVVLPKPTPECRSSFKSSSTRRWPCARSP